MKTAYLTKIITTLILVSIFSLSNFSPVFAERTPDEIEDEIQEKQEELEQINKELEGLEEEQASNAVRRDASLSELENINNELNHLKNQLRINELKKQKLAEEIKIKQLEKQGKKQEQDSQIAQSYISWKTDDDTMILFQGQDILKNAVYFEFVAEQSRDSILDIAGDLHTLNNRHNQYKIELKTLERDTEELEGKIALIEEQVNQYNSAIARAANNADGLRSRAAGVQQQIDQLSAEQQAILLQEDQQTGGGGGGGTKTIKKGEYFFSGSGRDLYQGHGVGMSQFGAYGAAQKGWSAKKIVEFYYTNTNVETRGGININVQGYGSMSADNYVAGLGEVPSKACGTADDITAWDDFADDEGWSNNDPRRDKYVLNDPNTVWECWPEEAIKAQVIAARSYGARASQPICTTAACQVYVGGQAKAWAAWETSNQYVISKGSTHNNQIITALYSSDNSQGYGTADNDTIWSNFEGIGTPYSYLRHVNDSGTAATWEYTNWKWRTNGYKMSDIDALLLYGSNNYTVGGANSFIAGVRSNIGKVNNLIFVRDGSNRVRYVTLQGTNGNRNMAGWLFKSLWNDWIYNVKPTGEYDYIYSLTWWLLKGE